MDEMPQRPQAHRTETRSRRKFAELVEEQGWVIRPVDSPDYGLDDIVEVFDGDRSTGIFFFVQSRGTEEESLEKALKLRIRRVQQNYFRSIELPVLIVRYHGPSDTTFARWFHQVDPYPRLENQTVTLTSGDAIAPSDVESLAAEASRFVDLKSAAIEWPLLMTVRSSIYSETELRLLIEEAISPSTDLLKLSVDAPTRGPYLSASVLPEATKVDAGIASFTLDGPPEGRSIEQMANAIVALSGFVLEALGHTAQAAELYGYRLLRQGVDADTLDRMGRAMGSHSLTPVALRIARKWAEVGDARHLMGAALLLGSVANGSPSRAVDERRLLAESIERLAMRLDELDDAITTGQGGAVHLMAARVRFAVGDWLEADRNFTSASERLRGDVSRPELLAEVAGAAHEAGDFTRAVEVYSKAIEAEPENARLLARRADSYFRNGDLTVAAREFEAYLERSRGPVETVWLLTRHAVMFLINSSWTSGPRDSATAARVHGRRFEGEDEEAAIRRCLAAMQRDFLYAQACRELGELQVLAGRPGFAYGPFMLAVLASRTPEAFAGLFVAARQGGSDELAKIAVHLGAGDHGATFFRAVLGSPLLPDAERDEAMAVAQRIDTESGQWRRR